MNQGINGEALNLILWVAFVYWVVWGSLKERPPQDSRQQARRSTKSGALAPISAAAGLHSVGELDESGWAAPARFASEVGRGLVTLHEADRSFDLQHFLRGASAAYEIIVTAFAEGDRKTLQTLLSASVYEAFAAEMAAREETGERLRLSFVQLNEPEILDVQILANCAHITVRFNSQIATVVTCRGAHGYGRVAEVADRWTFAREIGSPNANWILFETDAD